MIQHITPLMLQCFLREDIPDVSFSLYYNCTYYISVEFILAVIT